MGGVGEPGPADLKSAGLTWISDSSPGWSRQRRGRGFSYLDTGGQVIRDPAVREHVQSLVIPPAWQDVWISPRASGHLQATGRDDRGRKQYIYHPAWRELRDTAKYASLSEFASQLPKLRRRLSRDLAAGSSTPDRQTVTAATVSLLDRTLIRVGNSRYATSNGSYGLTTLQDEHVQVEGDELQFRFRGKSGQEFDVSLRNRRLAKIVRHCQELPGQELFQFETATGVLQVMASDDVNTYLRDTMGENHSAKDFRTWAGTVMTAEKLFNAGEAATDTAAKRNVTAAIRFTAGRLGNTMAVSRKCYVHPKIVARYMAGDFIGEFGDALESARGKPGSGLRVAEAATLAFITE
ncbi:MAG: DNA topoisomerase IB [Corynebacterium humireducens]|uniref:DNA topoisomerase n=1 Tax=Corynebacterium humireducens TaxID=1223514 RepID=A0A7X6PNL9_9CORY|nr:DNA topoisomerase IB [Corynebacterium humireducens]